MVHAAVGFARMRNRLHALACTASIGPGATNMVTGAALATINRLPVLLLPGDVFATRVANPVLQELEDPRSPRRVGQRRFRPVSRFFDRVSRPEQLPAALLGAMRVLTDPAETGAVTLALPQDVQAEALRLAGGAVRAAGLARGRARCPSRPRWPGRPSVLRSARTAADRRRRRRHLLRGRRTRCAAFAEATGIPVAETQAGKGALPYDHPQPVGARRRHRHHRGQRAGPRGRRGASASAPATATSPPPRAPPSPHAGVRFVNLNVAAFDAAKHAGARRWSPTPGPGWRR